MKGIVPIEDRRRLDLILDETARTGSTQQERTLVLGRYVCIAQNSNAGPPKLEIKSRNVTVVGLRQRDNRWYGVNYSSVAVEQCYLEAVRIRAERRDWEIEMFHCPNW